MIYYKSEKQRDFRKNCRKIHNRKYRYPENYNTAHEKIKIICPEHGEFEQTPHNHLNGQGCPVCRYKKISYDLNEFIRLSNKVHCKKYDYSKVQYEKGTEKVIIICPQHGEFNQRASNHLSGYGCPICNSSRGELAIKRFLDERKIKYTFQKTFDECRGKRNKLPFDFYLDKFNMCVEYDGEQHTVGWRRNQESLLKIKEVDSIKTNYCKDNNIKLLRINFTDFDIIDIILLKELHLLVDKPE
jgi:hypothetical protein